MKAMKLSSIAIWMVILSILVSACSVPVLSASVNQTENASQAIDPTARSITGTDQPVKS